ncbi:MAG: hypothetical protein Kow0042_20640 [Calditrichia bacterium]
MKKYIIAQKVKAYLHDPLHKALMLMQTPERHEDVAQRLAEIVGISLQDIEDVKLADQLASAADRFVFPDDKELMVKFLDDPVMTHPFSGAKLNFADRINSSGKTEIINEAYNAIKSTLEHYATLVNRHSDKNEQMELLYWLLWRRFLPDVQKKLTNETIRKIWPFLPAETRIPDHSLWNHLKVTAALSACVVEQENVKKEDWIDVAFLLFSIGPVQSFIGTARKTVDHWMGSFLLSYLNFIAMQAVFEEIGPDSIIFPELHSQPFIDAYLAHKYQEEFGDIRPEKTHLLTPSLPNRFLAIVPTGLAKELAKRAEQAVKTEWENIWKSGKSYFENTIGIQSSGYWEHLWQRQCTDYFEIYWLVLPWKKSFNEQKDFYIEWISAEEPATSLDEEKRPKILEKIETFYELKLFEHPSNLALAYPLIYELAEHLFGARKNWRYYQPSAQRGEPSFKCHLCGEREVLHVGEPKIPGYFEQFADVVSQHEQGQKFYRGTDEWQQIQNFWQEEILKKIETHSEARIQKFFKEGKRLCAVCATKRMAEFYFQNKLANWGFKLSSLDFAYPSTAEMAGLSFKKEIIVKATDQPEILDNFLNSLKHEREHYQTYAIPRLMNEAKRKPSLREFAKIDSGYMFNLLKESTRDEISDELSQDEAIRKSLKGALEEILRITGVKRSKLASYYCYLAMDGDKMGAWVSGKFLPSFEKVMHPHVVQKLESSSDEKAQKITQILEQRRVVTPSIHSMLSRIQNEFATTIARKVVEEENWGKLVYSGGDDVLAMAPVTSGLELAHQLRLAFAGYREKIGDGNGWWEEEENLQMRFGTEVTASVGLVIAHHTTPMRWVISKAQKMEKAAKRFGRNALGIALLKRSGEEVRTVVPFQAENQTDVIQQILLPLYRWIASGDISRDFVYVLKAEQAGFSDDSWEMFAIEMRRVLERKIKEKQKKENLLKEFENWGGDLFNLFKTMKARLEDTNSKNDPKSNPKGNNRIIVELLNMFSIIEFMAREG